MANITGVTITRPRHPRIRTIVREHGATFAYQRHTDTPQVAILLSCLCPGGHGPTHVPWKGWVSKADADMDLTQVEGYVSSYAIPAEIDADLPDADLIDMDLVTATTDDSDVEFAAAA